MTTVAQARPRHKAEGRSVEGEGVPAVLINIRGLASLLALSVPTLRRRDAAGQIPRPVRIAGAVRWRADEVRRWVEAGCPNRARWEAMTAPA